MVINDMYQVSDMAYMVRYSAESKPTLFSKQILQVTPKFVKVDLGFDFLKFDINNKIVSYGEAIYKLFDSKEEAEDAIHYSEKKYTMTSYIKGFLGVLSDDEVENIYTYVCSKLDEKVKSN